MTKKKNAVFGRYPCCDMVNNAIRHILNGHKEDAVEELLQAIWKANGYLHEDLEDETLKIHECVWKKRTAVKRTLMKLWWRNRPDRDITRRGWAEQRATE